MKKKILMKKEVIERLKLIPITHCGKCNSIRSYMNPMARCFECKKKFCFDHIYGGQFKKGMKQNEEGRSICEECKKNKGY